MVRFFVRQLGLSVAAMAIAAGGVRAAVPECPGDVNQDGEVTVDEILLAVNAALNGCEPGAPTCGGVALLSTGQTQCDQGSGTLGGCPGSPAGQDAEVAAGVTATYKDNGDGTITDEATGLTWEKLSADGGIHDWETYYTWTDAFEGKIATLNTPPCFAGHCDWRVPNRREMESLVNSGRAAPAVDPVFDNECEPGCSVSACSCTQFDFYWTSTSFQDLPDFGWAVDANAGIVNAFEKGVVQLPVRAVRGGL